MAETIAPSDVKLRYASLAEAKILPGLRLILGARAIPGPWREACKAIFHVKQVSYVPVAARGADGSDRELYDWTAQRSLPSRSGTTNGHTRPGSSNCTWPSGSRRSRH